ncbi:MAG TPA: UDP-glucuronic acid decarboxylase family protein [Candidatus Limnocylindrales bacterium]|nr:UDP-glucuronic acid decarboxylase family protein [Candidatus Limnocylindrales bacterium]
MLKILVAGGAGFIGSHLCKRLIDEGNVVYCFDNLITGSKDNIVRLLDNPNFKYFEYDITNPIAELGEINYIYHLASPASPNKKSLRSYINFPIETLLANSVGTYNLLNLAKEKNARFLFASTSEVYGNPAVSPQPETYFGNVNPNGIRSVYDEGKRFGEAMSFGFKRKFDVDVRIVRIFNTYGPQMQKDDGRVVSAFINQAIKNDPLTIFGNGDQTRSFCYVDDMVEGLVKMMVSDKAKGEVINLGNDDERNISDIAALVKEMTGSNSEIVFEELPEDDPTTRKPNLAKAKSILGWEAKTSLEEGLKKTIEYFRNI